MGEKPRLSRRQMLLMSGKMGLTATVLAACGGTPEQAAQPTAAPAAGAGGGGTAATAAPAAGGGGEPAKATGEIEFLAWGDNADIPAWEALTKRYAEVNPDLKINVTTVADPNNNYYTKLQTALAGGVPPAVASFQGWEWQTYANRGVLANVDELVARDNLTAPYDDSIASVKASTMWEDKRYLIPLQIATMVMFYAKKPFQDAGMEMPTDDWTFDQFLEMAQQVTNLSGNQKVYGYQPNGNWFRDIGWIRLTGKQEFDELVKPTKAQFNQPEIVEMVQMMAQDVIYKLNISPTPADTQSGANSIQTGNAAMKYEGPWFFGQLNSPELRNDNKQIEFDVVLMPQGADESRPHRGWAEGVALLQGDKVEQGWAFASFMAGEDGQKIYAEVTGRMPNNLPMVESFWVPIIQEKFQVQNGKAFVEAFKRSEVDVISITPRSKMWAEVVKPTGWDPLLNNSATAADVLPKVDEALQQLLNS